MIPPERFYVRAAGPLMQGDLLLAGVARLVAADRFAPAAWDQLDAHDMTVHRARDATDLWLEAGPALVMVTSHDCHFDKDWNIRRRALIRDGVDDDASRLAEDDATLDRTFTASPLVYLSEVDRDQGLLRAGRILGYLPVAASDDGLVPESVVDLTYRVTLDRLDVVRVASVSREARMHLRYGLAQLDSLRATTVGFELERVVGHHIDRVSFPRQNPLFVRLHLDDGTEVDLLQSQTSRTTPRRAVLQRRRIRLRSAYETRPPSSIAQHDLSWGDHPRGKQWADLGYKCSTPARCRSSCSRSSPSVPTMAMSSWWRWRSEWRPTGRARDRGSLDGVDHDDALSERRLGGSTTW